MIVYHGSADVVEYPDVMHSFRPLDFGKGFYVTTNLEQAERWARRKADLSEGKNPVVNVYEMSDDSMEFKVKEFPDDLREWIDFVCACRDGESDYLNYDIIKGKVANDKVFRVVDLYHAGVWDKERALAEIKVYPGYDQIAFISQSAIDSLLKYKNIIEV